MAKPDAVFLPRIRSSQRRKPFQLKPRRDLTMTVNKKDLDSRRMALLQLLRIQVTPFQASENVTPHREIKDQNEMQPVKPPHPLRYGGNEHSHHNGATTHTIAEFPGSSHHTPEQEKRIPTSLSSPPLIRRHPLPVLDKRESPNIPDHLLLPLLI